LVALRNKLALMMSRPSSVAFFGGDSVAAILG
jgi:hypothetical protein